ncbi:MAG: cation:proton antiporter family protein [Acidimicrobiales bacterium]|nr:cation:proton antiporter family protein [Acidimicrobiales bacterium]
MFESDFAQIAAAMLFSAGIGGVALLLRQPLIVAYLAAGVLVGPTALGWVTAEDQINLLAHVGVSILLFLVGLKLDVRLIRTMGPVALATGLGQVTFTSVIGFLIALALGFGATEAIYIAVALTFSSTIIIIKLLSDKRELEELHGRIAVGFLIVQDLVVIIVMITLTAVGTTGDDRVAMEILEVLAKGVGFLLAIIVLMRWVMPVVLDRIAVSQELMVLFAVGWAIAAAATSDALGLSSEVGAFLAGVTLASTAYRETIGARLITLRDVLLLFFFIQVGSALEFSDIGDNIAPAVVFSVFVLIGNPMIVMMIMGAMGYRKRTGFQAGLTVAQISEFSLILAALGFSLGHIDSGIVGLITIVGLVTIGLSTYLILYSRQIFDRIGHLLSIFERAHPSHGEGMDEQVQAIDVVLFGVGRFGGSILEQLVASGREVLAVDIDPEVLHRLRGRGIPATFGDLEEPELLASLPLGRARGVISTIPHLAANLLLIETLRRLGYTGTIAVTVHHDRDDEALSAVPGVTVLRPFSTAASQLVDGLVESDSPESPL